MAEQRCTMAGSAAERRRPPDGAPARGRRGRPDRFAAAAPLGGIYTPRRSLGARIAREVTDRHSYSRVVGDRGDIGGVALVSPGAPRAPRARPSAEARTAARRPRRTSTPAAVTRTAPAPGFCGRRASGACPATASPGCERNGTKRSRKRSPPRRRRPTKPKRSSATRARGHDEGPQAQADGVRQ